MWVTVGANRLGKIGIKSFFFSNSLMNSLRQSFTCVSAKKKVMS
jgi:hypothetical protein